MIDSINPSSRYYQPFTALKSKLDDIYLFKLVHNEDKDTYSLPYLYGNYKNQLEPIPIAENIITSIRKYLNDNLFSNEEKKLLMSALKPHIENFGAKTVSSLEKSAIRAEGSNHQELVTEYNKTISALQEINKLINKDLENTEIIITSTVPKVFISYSHDSEDHKDWVLQLATRLRSNGVDVILDRWNLKLGKDLPSFMEQGLSKSNRIICICSENYVKKANEGKGGAGYEKKIMTADLLDDQNSNFIIPLIKNNSKPKKVPLFLSGAQYISFEEVNQYESRYEELLRDILEEPILPIPPIGKNPFQNITAFSQQKFIPNDEKYSSPATKGTVTFDYSNNNGTYFIGQGLLMFELKFSKSSNWNIILYNDPQSIRTVALAKHVININEIEDARIYDGSSRTRRPNKDQIAVLQNNNGYYAAIKIINIKDDTRGEEYDEVTFEYVIQSNGSPTFLIEK